MKIMDIFRKKKKEEAALEAKEEAKDKWAVMGVMSGASRKRKDVVEAWKQYKKSQGAELSSSLLDLMTTEMKQDGLTPPSDVERALDGSAEIVKMAQISAQTVSDMVTATIQQLQNTAKESQEYINYLDDVIKEKRNQLTQLCKEISNKDLEWSKQRQAHDDWIRYRVKEQQELIDKTKELNLQVRDIEQKIASPLANSHQSEEQKEVHDDTTPKPPVPFKVARPRIA